MDFLSKTLPGIGELFSPLEQTIRAYLLPALSGKCAFSDAERQLISLPSRLGGLGITDPCVSSAFQFGASQRVTDPLVSLLLGQDSQFTIEILNEQLALRRRYTLRIVVDLRNWLLPYILCYLLSYSVLESWLV